MHCKAYKPICFQMHLTFDDSPLAGRLQEKNIEIITKLNDYESTNILLQSSYNAARQSIQQLESKVKTLKDGLHAKDAVLTELQDRLHIVETYNQYLTNKYRDNAMDFGSCSITNENNCIKNGNKKNGNKQQQSIHETTNNKQIISLNDIKKRNCYAKNHCNATNKCNDENYNASDANKGQHTTPLSPPEEKEEIFDDTPPDNSVVIQNIKSNNISLDSPITNVIRLGRLMDLRITSHEIHDIFVCKGNPPFLTYIVQFGNKKLKTVFLEKSPVLKNFRKTKSLTIS